jgi:hypothetical protein
MKSRYIWLLTASSVSKYGSHCSDVVTVRYTSRGTRKFSLQIILKNGIHSTPHTGGYICNKLVLHFDTCHHFLKTEVSWSNWDLRDMQHGQRRHFQGYVVVDWDSGEPFPVPVVQPNNNFPILMDCHSGCFFFLLLGYRTL